MATSTPLPLFPLPLQEISFTCPDDEFGDSPRDFILARLDAEAKGSCVYELPEARLGPRRGRRGARRGKRQGHAARPTACPASISRLASEDDVHHVPSVGTAPSGGKGSEGEGSACSGEASTSTTCPSSQGPSAAEDWPEAATTAMLRNIPNRYTAEELLAEMFSAGFEGSFDFFYLPIDFATKRNRGYGFVNFHSAADARRFVTQFHMQRLTRYTTHKILEVSPALTQGFEANVAQYVRRDAQRVQNPWFRPMIFRPDAGESCALGSTHLASAFSFCNSSGRVC